MAAIQGKDILLYIDGSPVCYEKDFTISIDTEVREVTKPPTSRAKSFAATTYSYKISSDGFVALRRGGKKVFYDLLLMQRDSIEVEWRSLSKSFLWIILKGRAIITNTSHGAPVDGFMTYSISLQGTGEIEISEAKQVVYGKGQLTYGEQQTILGKIITDNL